VLGWSLALLPVTLVAYSTSQTPWWGAASLFAVGLVYIGVLSGLSTVVQLRAPAAYRGRVLSFYLVALGVANPVGSLVQGPVIDRIGVGWTTAGSALLLALVMAAVAAWRPALVRAITTLSDEPPAALTAPGASPAGTAPEVPPAGAASCALPAGTQAAICE
jgi:predicted MFS family arabinose efflux permease